MDKISPELRAAIAAAFASMDAPDPTLAYNPGDTVTMKMWNGSTRDVRVIERHADIKNGKAGFEGLEGWGYDNQIVAINGVQL